MTGTVTTKMARLGMHLLTHPQYVRRYMQESLLTHKTPLDLEVPWFSFEAIEFLDQFLKPHMIVAEYGSGGSTIFFARRAAFVYSIEDNRDWYRSEEHTSELQSQSNLVCRLLLEKKKQITPPAAHSGARDPEPVLALDRDPPRARLAPARAHPPGRHLASPLLADGRQRPARSPRH